MTSMIFNMSSANDALISWCWGVVHKTDNALVTKMNLIITTPNMISIAFSRFSKKPEKNTWRRGKMNGQKWMENEKNFPRGKYFSSRKTIQIFLEYFPRINYSLDPYTLYKWIIINDWNNRIISSWQKTRPHTQRAYMESPLEGQKNNW